MCNKKFTCTVPVCCSYILTGTIVSFPLHTHTHACTHACAHTHTHTGAHPKHSGIPVCELFILVHTCTDQNMLCTHTHTHVHICMHTHTKTLAGLKLASRLNCTYNLHITFHLFVLACIHDCVHIQRSQMFSRYVAYSIWYTLTCIYTNLHVHAHTYSHYTHLFFRFTFFSRSGNPFLSFLAVPHA